MLKLVKKKKLLSKVNECKETKTVLRFEHLFNTQISTSLFFGEIARFNATFRERPPLSSLSDSKSTLTAFSFDVGVLFPTLTLSKSSTFLGTDFKFRGLLKKMASMSFATLPNFPSLNSIWTREMLLSDSLAREATRSKWFAPVEYLAFFSVFIHEPLEREKKLL